MPNVRYLKDHLQQPTCHPWLTPHASCKPTWSELNFSNKSVSWHFHFSDFAFSSVWTELYINTTTTINHTTVSLWFLPDGHHAFCWCSPSSLHTSFVLCFPDIILVLWSLFPSELFLLSFFLQSVNLVSLVALAALHFWGSCWKSSVTLWCASNVYSFHTSGSSIHHLEAASQYVFNEDPTMAFAPATTSSRSCFL